MLIYANDGAGIRPA